MAIVDVNFHSNCLNRMVTYKAIIPTEHKLKNKPFKTLYLLHGITDNHNQWIVGTRIVLLANRYRLAVIMLLGKIVFMWMMKLAVICTENLLGVSLLNIHDNSFIFQKKEKIRSLLDFRWGAMEQHAI